MDGETLARRLAHRKPVYGVVLTAPLPVRWLWILRKLKVDFAIVDMEHSSLGYAEAAELVSGLVLVGCAPIVRVMSADPVAVTKVMDTGAHGVLLPHCESSEDIIHCANAARYRPLRGTSLTRLRQDAALRRGLRDYCGLVNRNAVVLAAFESLTALENLPELMSCVELDGIFVGLHELSAAMGTPGDYESTEVRRCLAKVAKACHEKGQSFGFWPLAMSDARRLKRRGMNIVVCGADYGVLYEGYQRQLNALR